MNWDLKSLKLIKITVAEAEVGNKLQNFFRRQGNSSVFIRIILLFSITLVLGMSDVR